MDNLCSGSVTGNTAANTCELRTIVEKAIWTVGGLLKKHLMLVDVDSKLDTWQQDGPRTIWGIIWHHCVNQLYTIEPIKCPVPGCPNWVCRYKMEQHMKVDEDHLNFEVSPSEQEVWRRSPAELHALGVGETADNATQKVLPKGRITRKLVKNTPRSIEIATGGSGQS